MIPTPRINTAQQSVPTTLPPPIGGLNGRDPLAAMAATDAYLMDNWFPGTASVDSRKGSEKFSTAALGAPVQSLAVYSGGDGDKLLAWAGGKIFDVSTGVPNQLVTGQVTSLAVTTMFSNSADNSQHLICCTGTDTPNRYSGAGFTNLALTGMVGLSSTLNFVFAFKGRLYFGQKDKLGFYYLPVGAIQGALSYYDLQQFSSKGGYLVAIASFSMSTSGSEPADYIVFITSKGECLVYGGFDPSSAVNWGIIGRYYMAPPIGRKCTINYGSELIVLTQEGAVPFSDVRRSGDAKAQGVSGSSYSALTSKLGSFLSDFNANVDVPGWEGLQYSGGGGWLILNVPTTGSIAGAYYHFVMNTTTNAWCRFTNWNGLCFAVFNRSLYFGRFDGYVMQGDVGRLDDEEPILLDVKQAYNYFDDGAGMAFVQKHFQWAAALVSCDGEPPLSGRFNVDFVEQQPDYVNILAPGSGAEWDTGIWDVDLWGDDNHTQRFIITLNKGGVAGALWLRASLQGLTLRWFATQYVMEKTRGLLI